LFHRSRTRERWPPGRRLKGALLTAIVALAAVWVPALARADGDPASDVLVTQPLFVPQDANFTLAQQTELGTLLDEAQRGGVPIRVAVIGSSADMGSVTALWRQPQSYAQFLGIELSLVNNGRVLIVMPEGLGIYHGGAPTTADRAALAGAPSPGAAGGLAGAALSAVQRLAAAAGHPLTAPQAPAPAPAPSNPHTNQSPVPWIVLILGSIVVAAAWIASLRARPLRAGGRKASSV
jgi:hypothetical protein